MGTVGEVQGPLASAEALRRDGKYEDARKALDAAVAQAAPDDVESVLVERSEVAV